MASVSGPRSPLDLATAGVLSVAGHTTAAFAILGILRLLALLELFNHHPASAPAEPPVQTLELPPGLVEIELPAVAENSPLLASEKAPRDVSEVVPGGSTVTRIDQDRKGRGGDDRVAERALNFADQDDRITRVPSSMSNLELSQIPRIDTHKRRRSYEDYRASREPMELTFVAMGTRGDAQERRPEARFDPARGLRIAALRNELGGMLGAPERPRGEGESERPIGTDTIGARVRSPGQGATRASDLGAESPALVNAHARPLVAQGDPSIPALSNGRPNDDEEDPQAVATRMLSIQHASTAGGKQSGEGRGGDQGAGPTGAGGQKGAGQTASPAGAGGLGPADVERMGYVRSVQTKVHPLWGNAFPRWAALEGRGGVCVVSFTIQADGSVSSARVSRASGIPEFDENVRKAVLRGAPFGKLPAALGSRFSMSLTFNSPNPAVRPKFSNDGVQ